MLYYLNFQQLLLVHFDKNEKFKRGQRIMTEFKEKSITPRLVTKQGDLLYDDEHTIGNWNLTTEQHLTVRLPLYRHCIHTVYSGDMSYVVQLHLLY